MENFMKGYLPWEGPTVEWKKAVRSPPTEEGGVANTDDGRTDDCNYDELTGTSIPHSICFVPVVSVPLGQSRKKNWE